ncbi:hypothetical protein EB796_003503 [Bugula neritina]|uniref:Uncharacterized protein n=1 Tax=Bugula neritina TaxID=10212 RepID=A0A7J7KIY6_BUGNE|nr:hypothetical protein EB796_003503 [Bugula neritina]
MENGYLEPQLSFKSDEEMNSPTLEQQVNRGYAESPARRQHPNSSELETSFSDQLNGPVTVAAAAADPPSNLHINGLRGPTTSSAQFSNRSNPSTPAEQPISYQNGSVQLPWHYYQYLQQLAVTNPTINMNGSIETLQNTSTLHPPSTVLQNNHSQRIAQTASVPPTPKMEAWQPANPSQIYEEIPTSKMYVEAPVVPTSSRPNQAHSISDQSTDSLLHFSPLQRRKENPLYGENNNKDIPDTAPLNSENGLVGKELYRRSPVARCLCVGLLLALIISFTALTIVVLSLTGVLTFQTSHTSGGAVAASVQKSNTSQVIMDAQSQLSNDFNSLRNETHVLHQKIQELENLVSSLNSLQMIQRSNFTDLLAEGILDLSSCELLQSIKQLRINSFSTGEVSSTNTKKIIAVSCNTENYQNHILSSINGKYSCRCSGLIDSTQDGTCTMNYMQCSLLQ